VTLTYANVLAVVAIVGVWLYNKPELSRWSGEAKALVGVMVVITAIAVVSPSTLSPLRESTILGAVAFGAQTGGFWLIASCKT